MHWRQIGRFAYFYLKSMRLYYAFITGIAGWVGVSFYKFLTDAEYDPRSVLIIILLFFSWGFNQVINDYLGLAEDRVNAPHRPMVTGDLNIRWSLTVSVSMIVMMIIISYFLNPWAIIPVVCGVGLNILYEYAKAWSLCGNLVYGISIAMCTIYGFLASGPLPKVVFTYNRVSALILIVIANALMAYFSYFKDHEGDKQAGKKTFHVRHGLKLACQCGIVGAFLPTLIFLILMQKGWLPWGHIIYKEQFIFCGLLAFFLELWTAMRFFYYPRGVQTYFSLITNAQACVAAHVAIIAIYDGMLALYLMVASYVFIDFLFGLHKDAKS